jgi:hypothetical protein
MIPYFAKIKPTQKNFARFNGGHINDFCLSVKKKKLKSAGSFAQSYCRSEQYSKKYQKKERLKIATEKDEKMWDYLWEVELDVKLE